MALFTIVTCRARRLTDSDASIVAIRDRNLRGTPLVTSISRDELHRLITTAAPVTLIEALGPAYFADAHIPGALNIPPDQVDRLAPKLVPDFVSPVIVYSSGTCQNSQNAARRLEELGYRNVQVYSEGKEDWVEHGLPVERSPGTD